MAATQTLPLQIIRVAYGYVFTIPAPAGSILDLMGSHPYVYTDISMGTNFFVLHFAWKGPEAAGNSVRETAFAEALSYTWNELRRRGAVPPAMPAVLTGNQSIEFSEHSKDEISFGPHGIIWLDGEHARFLSRMPSEATS